MIGSNKDDILSTPEQKAAGEKPPLQTGCERFGEARSRQSGIPTFVYYFTRDLPGDNAGAFHSAELWYTFGTVNRAWRPFTAADRELSEQMLDYWTLFMKNGNPNGSVLPYWAPYTTENPFVRTFDV